MSDVVKHFIPLAVVITLVCGLVYVLAQQNYRMTANDPQVQFSQDIARSLSQGVPPEAIIPASRVDMSKSLAVFIMVFNKDGKQALSTGEIDGKIPEVPKGVFDFTKKNGEDRITWQPQSGVRAAIVVTPFKDGYVLVGRSLKEVEKRINTLGLQVFLAWVIIMIAAFFVKFLTVGKMTTRISRRR